MALFIVLLFLLFGGVGFAAHLVWIAAVLVGVFLVLNYFTGYGGGPRYRR